MIEFIWNSKYKTVTIMDTETDRSIGSISRGLGWLPGRWAVGYSLDSAYRQRGIMARALTFYVEQCPMDQFQAVTEPDNIASQKTLLKSGFRLVEIDDFTGRHVYIFDKNNLNSKAA
jgi:RimJ/RimL family protein N-acetyltransferase